MKFKYIAFIFIITILLLSTIATAGFWQDVTGMFSFSFSKIFKKQTAQQTLPQAEKIITTECKAYINGKCATELQPKLNMNLQKNAKLYVMESKKTKIIAGKTIKVTTIEKAFTRNVKIGTKEKSVKVPVVNICIDNKCKNYGVDETIEVGGVVYDLLLVEDKINLIPKGVPIITPHEEDISKITTPFERFKPKTYGPPPFRTTPTPRIFKVGVIIDRDTVPAPQASREDILEALRLANNKLRLRSTNIQFELQDIVELNMGHYAPGEWDPTPQFIYIDNYYLEHISSPPNGVIIFREDPTASSYGGYAIGSSEFSEYGFCNNFTSPLYGSSVIYGGVLDWDHMYAACGYDDYENHISDISIDGQCFNSPGTPCVLHNGYYMCSNTDFENDEYARQRLSFVADSLIHEFLHSFSATLSHYCTPDCPSSCELIRDYAGMCPAAWDSFIGSWHICDSLAIPV